MLTTRFSFLCALLVLPGGSLWAQDDVIKAAMSGVRAAGEIEKAAGKVRDGISEIDEDAAFNRLDEPAPNQNVVTAINGIPREQAAPLVAALNAANAIPDEPDRRDALLVAFARQKEMELKVKTLAVQYSAAEAQQRLVREIALLMGKQMKNLRQTTELAEAASPTASASRRRTIAGLEQAALEEEVRLVALAVSQQPPDWANEDPLPQVAAVKKSLRPPEWLESWTSATRATQTGPLDAAVVCQKETEKKLSTLLDRALDTAPLPFIGADAKKLLAGIVADERQLRQATIDAATDPATLEERQTRLQERTLVLQRLLARLNPDAAKRAQQAAEKMKVASQCMKPGKGMEGAVPAESEAIGLLEDASGMLPGQDGMGGPGEGEGGQEMTEQADGGPNSSGEGIAATLLDPEGKGLPPGSAQALGELVKKEREAVSSSEQEGALPEYAPMIEQYLRSLSEPTPPP